MIYVDGFELMICYDMDNGIFFEGIVGCIFVNCGKLVGKLVEDLVVNLLLEGVLEWVYKDCLLMNYVVNFFDVVVEC